MGAVNLCCPPYFDTRFLVYSLLMVGLGIVSPKELDRTVRVGGKKWQPAVLLAFIAVHCSNR